MVVYLKGDAIVAPSSLTYVVDLCDFCRSFGHIQRADLARSLNRLTVCLADYGEPDNRGEGQY